MISTMHKNEVNPGEAEHSPGGQFGGHSSWGDFKPSHSKKPHPPVTAAGEGEIFHEKAAKLRARVCSEGFVVDFGGNVHYSVAWTTLWLREDLVPRGRLQP
jgi:hypothetical protein